MCVANFLNSATNVKLIFEHFLSCHGLAWSRGHTGPLLDIGQGGFELKWERNNFALMVQRCVAGGGDFRDGQGDGKWERTPGQGTRPTKLVKVVEEGHVHDGAGGLQGGFVGILGFVEGDQGLSEVSIDGTRDLGFERAVAVAVRGIGGFKA